MEFTGMLLLPQDSCPESQLVCIKDGGMCSPSTCPFFPVRHVWMLWCILRCSRACGKDPDQKIKTSSSWCWFWDQFTMALIFKFTEVCLISARIRGLGLSLCFSCSCWETDTFLRLPLFNLEWKPGASESLLTAERDRGGSELPVARYWVVG